MAVGATNEWSPDRGGTTIGGRSKGQGARIPLAPGAGAPGAGVVGAQVGAYTGEHVGAWPEGQAGVRPSRRDAHSDGRGSGHGRGRPGLLAVAARVSEILGGLIDPRIVREVGVLTGDDLEAVTEVVFDAKETGCLEQGTEAWKIAAPLPTRRLVALATARLGQLPVELQEEARLLALGSPLTIRAAGAVLDPRRVRELEALGWARFRCHGRDQQVVIADPVRREAVLARLADGERLCLLRRLADAVDDAGEQPGDVLRVARWRLQVGGWPAERYQRAAAMAYAGSETVLAEALAARAVELGDRGQGVLMHAVTLTAHHQVERAEAADIRAQADGRLDQAWVALTHAHRQAIGHGRWGQAARTLERAVEHVPRSPSASQLLAYSALLHALDGDPAASDRALGAGGAGDRPSGEGRVCSRGSGDRAEGVEARVVAEVAAAFSAAARLDRPGVKRSAAVVAELSTGYDEVPLASELVRGLALLAADPRPPQELLASVSEELDRALGGPDPVLAWWMTVAGRLHLAGGDLDAARDRFTQALMLTDVADPVRLRPRLIVDLALVAALSGVPTEAQRRLDELGDEAQVSSAIAFRCELVDIVIAAQYHGPVEATRTALACGDRALDEGRLRDAVFAWHLTARFGDAGAAMERLTGTPTLPDHPAVASARRHAVAMAEQDGPGLLLVAKDLAAAGRYLVAAESAAQAARLTGEETAFALARGLAAACTDVRSPMLEGIEPVVLSPRRAEVAQAVAQGKSGPAMARELDLSLRTVNNHLSRVYRLLGVANRQELQRVYRSDLRPLAG